MRKVFFFTAIFFSLTFIFCAQANKDINMNEVSELAKLSVDEILKNSPVETFAVEDYGRYVQGRNKPLVVFFYSNIDGPSQRLATLIRYIAPHYKNKMSFGRVKVVEKGKPEKIRTKMLASKYSLDDTPGILFYHKVGKVMVLEDEEYIDADFKEFRTPSMVLWKTYYKAVRKELDKLLAD